LTDAHAHAYALRKFKPFVILVTLAVLVSGCTSKSKNYTYQSDEAPGVNAQSEFNPYSTPLTPFTAGTDQILLSGNLFDQTAGTATPTRRAAPEKVLSENLFDLASVQRKGSVFERMLHTAASQIGTRYRSGGCDPNTGFDCSGFTTWVFNRYGIHLPRSSREQYQVGKEVARNSLRKGDLVFFRSRRGINHVGIYLEDGKFIHSASNGKTVIISHLEEDYWRTHYAGGRRVF
jgi:cell wall-associated NlpC family hydrolase